MNCIFILGITKYSVTHLFPTSMCLNERWSQYNSEEYVILTWAYGPRQANLLLIAYASSEGSGEPAHPRSLARTSTARSYKQWVKRNLQTESQIHSPSEWLGMRSWNLSWRNARRHKFAWRGWCHFNMSVLSCIISSLSYIAVAGMI